MIDVCMRHDSAMENALPIHKNAETICVFRTIVGTLETTDYVETVAFTNTLNVMGNVQKGTRNVETGDVLKKQILTDTLSVEDLASTTAVGLGTTTNHVEIDASIGLILVTITSVQLQEARSSVIETANHAMVIAQTDSPFAITSALQTTHFQNIAGQRQLKQHPKHLQLQTNHSPKPR